MSSRAAGHATIVASCLAQLIVTVDMTVLYLAAPELTVQLGASNMAMLWIVDVYGFTMAGLLVTFGNLGDRLGRRRMLVWGVTAFAATSVLAAYAPTAEVLIVARALMGVAGAAILPATTSLLRVMFTTQRARTAAVGASAGVSAAGFAVGPIIGGVLLNQFWWGSVFLINIPIALFILIATRFIPESRAPQGVRMDLASVLLSVVGVVAVVYTIKTAFVLGLWHLDVMTALVVGVVALGLFARRQLRLPVPLIDLRLFHSRQFTASVGSNLIAVFTLSAFGLIISQYFQLVREWTPLNAGLAYVPGALAAVLAGGVLAASVINRIGRGPAVALGLVLAAIGFGVLATVQTQSPYMVVVFAQVAVGAGAGLTLTVTGDTILGTVPRDRAGAAAAISVTAYELGGSLGIAVIGSVLSGIYRAELLVPPGVPQAVADQVQESFGAAVTTALPEPVATAVRTAATEAFLGGVRTSMVVSAAVTVLLALVALGVLRGVPKVIEQEPAREPDPALGA
ncbi:MFS transporter [Lentzea jiangxiensis]|uniref:MFS transporter, DHA2 family, multidrug resistance protein n=1 Tax=Lentzea jiangxiensis TaxID=641025 RepID=A0A1H0KYZ4_9PSEU|nr:MFS transporter [Lentzea jiangxiensis]SDO61207.1 MFS transporter, DHA2 family, multidrug resistance protein [Lentzea jiangxiensis]